MNADSRNVSVMRSLVFKPMFGSDRLDEFLSATDSNIYGRTDLPPSSRSRPTNGIQHDVRSIRACAAKILAEFRHTASQ